MTRSLGTVGMLPGGMTPLLDTRSEEDHKEEAAPLAGRHHGCLAGLKDDTVAGESPRGGESGKETI